MPTALPPLTLWQILQGRMWQHLAPEGVNVDSRTAFEVHLQNLLICSPSQWFLGIELFSFLTEIILHLVTTGDSVRGEQAEGLQDCRS